MNNVKSLSIILLLSLGVASYTIGKDCNDGSRGRDCDRNSCSDDRNDDCCLTSTFIRPRQYTTDLTYLNNLNFYNRKHDARCSFLTWEGTIFYQENRKEQCLGVGFFGANPAEFGEAEGADFNVNNLNIGIANSTENFKSLVSVCPERKVVGWLSHAYANLDCFCTGLWADITFAVVRAKHRLNFNEELESSEGNLQGGPKTVTEAFGLDPDSTFEGLSVFANECKKTSVDDVMFRIGYDYCWCNNDTVGVYFLGIAPTGSSFNNALWWQPIVGSKHGAVGAGLQGDYTIWVDECNNTEVVFQTELLYQFRLRHDENRIFDLDNGTFSRALLTVDGATQATRSNPINAFSDNSLYNNLVSCVRVEPRHQVEWWANFHYQWCNWGAEFAYNLWFRDHERVDCDNFDFGDNVGIFDNSNIGVCQGMPTSGSTNTIATLSAQGTHDPQFVSLGAENVDQCSAVAQRVLTHKIGAAFSYNSVWCDCYPWLVGFGAGYEFASREDRCHALENWHVYGKWAISW